MIRLAIALLAALLAVLPGAAPAADPNEAALERLRQRIHRLDQQVQRDKARQDEHEAFLESTEKQAAELAVRLRKLRGEADAQQKKLAATVGEQVRAEQLLGRHRTALMRQVRAAYVIGKQGQTKLLLSQQDAQRLGRVLVYYEFLNRARGERIGAIQKQLREIGLLARRQTEEARSLTALRDEQEAALTALRQARGQRSLALRQLRQRLQSGADQLAGLRRQESDLESLMRELREALAEVTVAPPAPESDGPADAPFPALKGKLRWPLRGKLLASYGQPKAGGKLAWNGWWIDAPEGAPVAAIARGRVAYVGWMHRYGLIAIVEHEGGYFSLYGHNQSVTKAAGDWVAAGEPLALAGASGGHERPGVYFEVRKGTQPLNPKLWLGK